MSEKDFFKDQTESSRVKATIVATYFPQYCKILLKYTQPEIRYLDLFAGPGKYTDGNHSTPLLLASACASDPILSKKVHMFFNDYEKDYTEQLKANFNESFPPGTFTFEPRFGNKTVGEDIGIQDYLSKDFGSPNPHPTLLFFDPFGYKGIDTLVLAKFLANWGNEIFLFFNIKRIHAAIENNKFDELMVSLFPTSIQKLRNDRKYKATTPERLKLIMDNLASEFENAINEPLFHCAFKFKEEDSDGTSHFIIHFSKHRKGYELVKQIYDEYDNIGATLENDGTYTYDAKKMGQSSDSMINFGDQNIELLSKQLVEKYSGKTITAKDLFDEHHPSTLYCNRHYAKTLRSMVEDGKLRATFIDNAEHKVSVLLNDKCILKFD